MAVIGSGIMSSRLVGDNVALGLLAHSLAVGAVLVVILLISIPISGGHINPALTLAFLLRKGISKSEAALYAGAQCLGALAATGLTHLMYDLPVFTWSETVRSGVGQSIGELLATFGLIATILGCLRSRSEAIPYAVGLFVMSGIWFTSSTCFANPALTIGRVLTNSVTGISATDAPAFIGLQLVGAVLATGLFAWIDTGKYD